MPVIVDSSHAYIQQLRARSRDPDTLAVQLRLRAMLEQADLKPVGLPAQAIVVLRRLRAPLPLRQTVPSSAWQPALQAALTETLRVAVRAAHGPIPAHAEAIIFEDRAEVLACLARDWCAGTVSHRWWWRSLLGSGSIDQAALRLWLEQPQHVPAALHQLAATNELITWLRALPPGDAATLLGAVVHTFGLREIAAALEPVLRAPQVTLGGSKPKPVTTATAALPPVSLRIRQTVFPELDGAELPTVHQALLAVGLLLRRAPNLARAPQLSKVLIETFTAAECELEQRQAAANVDESSRASQLTAPRPALPVQGRVQGADSASIMPQLYPAAGHPNGKRTSAPQFTAAPVRVDAATNPLVLPASSPAADVPAVAPSQELGAWRALPMPPAPNPAPFLASTTITTAYGGLLYLVNLALFLDLYADFTQPLTPGLALPVWDWLALVGQELAGSELHADPLWPLLAQLAGRAPWEQPGASFEPPSTWRVSPAWLHAFPEPVAWRWWPTRSRLQVAHPAGFMLLDVPRAGPLQAQLAHKLAVYTDHRPAAVKRVRVPPPPRSPLRRWLHWIVPYIQARLVRALGLDTPAQLPDLLLRRTARIAVTPVQLDVHLLLAELPLAVRLAGLDRDPGWVPAAGRTIAFHFEL